MLVKTISELTKDRVRVTLENDFSFVIYKGEVRLYGVKEGVELKEAYFEEIMNVVLPKRAKLYSMNLLKVRPYTVKNLKDKLREKGYPESIIDIALEYVESFHYVDDLQYARDYIYTYKATKNKLKLIQDLSIKGVSKDLIEQAFLEELENDDENYEEIQIKKYLDKKHYSKENSSYEEKMKILSYLYRKGYSADLCRKVMDD